MALVQARRLQTAVLLRGGCTGQGGAEGGEQAFSDTDGIRSKPSRKLTAWFRARPGRGACVALSSWSA